MIQFSFNDSPKTPMLSSDNVLNVYADGRESLPSMTINLVEGEMDVNKSAVKTTGKIYLHPFRAIVDCPDCGALLEVCEDVDGKTRGADGTQAATATMLSHSDPGNDGMLSPGAHIRVYGVQPGDTRLHTLRGYKEELWTPEFAGSVLAEVAKDGAVSVCVQRVTAENL